jgi:hypothetical protein
LYVVSRKMTDLTNIVTRRLHVAPQPQEHPDANLLNGFTEKSLNSKERLQVLEHLAQCAHCRDVVSLALPPAVVADSTVLVPHYAPVWLRWPVLRWGALAACLVIVGAAVTLRLGYRRPTEPVSDVRQTTPSAPKAVASGVASKDEATPGAPAVADLGPAASQPTQPNRPRKLPIAKAPENENEDQGELAHGGDQTGAAKPTLMADSTAPAEVVPGRAKEAGAASSETGANDTSANQTGAGVMSPSSSVVPRWTLSSDGILQRSLDSGRTWKQIPVSSLATFRALAATGLDIWVGGSGGALYHSADAGEHWVQVRPVANGEYLTADILGVEFTDALHGKLTVSGHGTWTTADAGQTWQKK